MYPNGKLPDEIEIYHLLLKRFAWSSLCYVTKSPSVNNIR